MIRRAIVAALLAVAPAVGADAVDPSSLRGKVLCGYQGWFRCPGDAAGGGWVHWSRDGRRIAPETLTFEMWPDMSELADSERHAASGFTYPDGKPAELFSSDDPATVLRHFRWMKEAGVDGVWLQQFLGDLRGDPSSPRMKSHRRVLDHVRKAAGETGRVWAITFDIAGTPGDRIFDTITREWKRLVDEGVTRDPRYVREKGRPVVEVFGFFQNERSLAMTSELTNKLADFFHEDGPYRAFLVGSGDWNWRRNFTPEYRAALLRLDGFAPWNIGNTMTDASGAKRANTRTWADDRREFERDGRLWLPVVYPGFSWDNLKRRPAGSTTIPRREGQFLWEQFAEAKRLGVDSAFVAMFDEVDEGTAVFKATSALLKEGHFVGYEGLPSDWYLRLVSEGARMLRGGRAMSEEIPIRP